jgi:glycosyltransferase involved in cell wall biosynthesis
MRLVLVADTFPPTCSSASIQLWDLAVEIKRLGHDIWVLVPTSNISQASVLEDMDGINVLRLNARKTKDIGFIKRAVNEFLLPFLMIKHFRSSHAKDFQWDGVIWYSPTIFLGPVAWYLKKGSGCKAYLILRDIFPKWALDLELIKKGPVYFLLKIVETFQYWVADVIGIQSSADMKLMSKWNEKGKRKIELLNNWLDDHPNIGCSVSIDKTSLAGRKILVYAGNMGIAQDVRRLLDLAYQFKENLEVGFLFIGRGDQVTELKDYARTLNLKNTLFLDEIQPEEIPGLYSQCTVGLISLDERHKSSNIPGKFISYMQFGLPTIALVNKNNELIDIIKKYKVGLDVSSLISLDNNYIFKFLDDVTLDRGISDNCLRLYREQFRCKVAVEKILLGLS